jgi:SAM-dependent methyltransferase
MSCPICGSPAKAYCHKRAVERDWEVAKCVSCGHGFVVNRPDLSLLKDLYAAQAAVAPGHTHESSVEYFDSRPDSARDIVRLTHLRGRSLDVGSGDGTISYHLKKHGFRPLMIDVSEWARRQASCVPGGSYRMAAFEDLDDPGPFDVIVMSQVLEHALEPVQWLNKASRLLAPGGVLAVGVPNFGGVYRVLGDRDPFIAPPFHLNYFTPDSIRIAFERAGLQARRISYASRVNVAARPGWMSRAKRVLGNAWNLTAAPLADAAHKGILLLAYAAPRQ